MWVVNSAVIAAVALLLALPAGPRDALVLYGLYFALVIAILGANAFTLYMFLSSRDAFTRVMAWIVRVLLYLVVVMVLNAFVASDESPLSSRIGWALIVVIFLTLATTFWPRTHGPQSILDWSVQGAATQLAAKSLTKKYETATRELQELLGEP